MRPPGGWQACGAVIAASAVVLVAMTAVAHASPRPTVRRGAAVSVVRGYLRALGDHDAAGACQTFSPQLRRYLHGWEAGPSCRTRVAAAHFSAGSPGASVHRISLVAARVSEDRHGTVRVAMRVRYRYPCTSEVGPIPGCRPHVQTRADRVYLRATGGRLLIVKPGEVYVKTSSVTAPDGFDPFAPPGDRTTLRWPVRVRSAAALCPGGGRSVIAPHHTLQSQTGARVHRLAITAAPWLGITGVHASWLAGDQLCVAISLAATPRADASYSIDLEQPHHGGGLSSSYDAGFDGVGDAMVRLADPPRAYRRGRSACLTSAGVHGRQLVLVASPGDAAFDLHRPLHVDVSSESLQPGEPLLTDPLDAQDAVPADPRGLTLPPPTARARCRATAALG